MEGFDYDLGIIGGGAAGLTAAAGGAQFGAKTILIEKSGRLGGDCLHYGCVPSKTLIRTAGVWSLARRSAEFGLPALSMPPVDLASVMNRVREVIARIQHHDSVERFCGLGAEVRFGRPVFANDHVVTVDGKRIAAKNWIIATGSGPVVPPVEGLAGVPYWTNETVFSQEILPSRLIVLGGGPIGLEIAQAFGRLGSQVIIVEFLDQILGPEDADMAAVLKARLEAEGLKIHTGTKAVRAQSRGSKILLTIAPASSAGEERVIEGDAIVVSTGRAANVGGLGLEAAGVAFTARGIPTDLRMRTNIRHIYACGDVNGQLPFTHVAGYEAGIALTNSVLHLPRKADYGRIGWCTYTDPEVASVGLNEKRARKEGIDCQIFEELFADNDRALAEGETLGKIKILLNPKGKLLGCQIIGSQAGELIHEWVIAMAGAVKLSTIAGAVHIYPTLSEISKRAAGQFFSGKIFSDTTKTILRFLFSLKGRACTPPS
ncbi:MAG: FAD-dependent oxidoreductase [Syntrophales bacterium]|jgi:pyruvate/2-oxoglutarate dehydrogenase complex dihydrolipoamide dehydrogenase (E3) component